MICQSEKCCQVLVKPQKLFCSHKCSQRYSKEKTVKYWLENHNFPSYSTPDCIKEYLREQQNDCCAICGFSTWEYNHAVVELKLELDHVDGDPFNNVRENLRMICPNCHALTDTYKAKNKGRGRKMRIKMEQS